MGAVMSIVPYTDYSEQEKALDVITLSADLYLSNEPKLDLSNPMFNAAFERMPNDSINGKQ
jgi:hypothetical protein